MILPTRDQITDAIERYRAWPERLAEMSAAFSMSPWADPDAQPYADLRAYLGWVESTWPQPDGRHTL